jgi:hypothetical protein
MKAHSELVECAAGNAIGALSGKHLLPAKDSRVLSVGPVDRGLWIHDALSDEPNSRLTIATDYRQLWEIPSLESVQVAILDDTLSTFELEAACRLIRRRWPPAKILVVSRRESLLEDALYDDRVVPTVTPTLIRTTIERLMGTLQ